MSESTGKIEIRITRRKRHADGWRVWARYPWQERGKTHDVVLTEKGRPYCSTCDQFCIGYIAVSGVLSGRTTIKLEEEEA